MYYNGEEYFTIEEAIERSDKRIRDNAKKFAKKVIEMQQKQHTDSKKEIYV